MEKELKYLSEAIEKPSRPLAALIGGAKVSTKLPVLKSLLSKCDKILLGGGMIFTFYRAQGLQVGKSLVEEKQIPVANEVINLARERKVKLILPTDVVVAEKPDATVARQTVQH